MSSRVWNNKKETARWLGLRTSGHRRRSTDCRLCPKRSHQRRWPECWRIPWLLDPWNWRLLARSCRLCWVLAFLVCYRSPDMRPYLGSLGVIVYVWRRTRRIVLNSRFFLFLLATASSCHIDHIIGLYHELSRVVRPSPQSAPKSPTRWYFPKLLNIDWPFPVLYINIFPQKQSNTTWYGLKLL